MIRFLFYLIFGYFILRLIKVLVDPIFDQQPSRQRHNGTTSNNAKESSQKAPKPGLGEYVEFEEIK